MNNFDLKTIQLPIQQIVNAIASVLKIEIEVADKHLFRVAGTGQIKSQIWKEMNGEDLIYKRCIQTKQTIVIENPGFNSFCSGCLHFGHCKEHGEICCPIILDGEAIGVIGLIAFDKIQQQRLFTHKVENIAFLEQIAQIIATKMQETKFYKNYIVSQKKISTIFDYVDTGIISINQDGACEYVSKGALHMLHMDEAIESFVLQQLLEQAENIPNSGRTVFIDIHDTIHKFHMKYQKIEGNQAVIMLDNPKNIESISHSLLNAPLQNQRLIGNHSSIQNIRNKMSKFSNNSMPILIIGEQGTGRSYIAELIHQQSPLKDKPFHRFNCSYYSEEQLLKQLFGYHMNTEYLKGKLELAHQSTILIEEIETMPINVQARFMKFLEDGLIFRKGKLYPINTRIIVSSNHYLIKQMKEGLFRKDLYYKLNITPIHVPTLHERSEDILPLAENFLKQNSPTKSRQFSREAKIILENYTWPGNIKELENVIAYICDMTEDPIICPQHLPEFLTRLEQQNNIEKFNLQTIEIKTITEVLETIKRVGGSKDQAAQLLGISRATLFRKIKDYQIGL